MITRIKKIIKKRGAECRMNEYDSLNCSFYRYFGIFLTNMKGYELQDGTGGGTRTHTG